MTHLRTLSRLVAGGAGAALILAGGFAATAAYADPGDTDTLTTNVMSYSFDADTAVVRDSRIYYHYTNTAGWLAGAVAQAGALSISYCGAQGTFGTGGSELSAFNNSPYGSSATVDWTMGSACGDLDVRATLAFDGGSASYTYTFSSPVTTAVWHLDTAYTSPEWTTIDGGRVLGRDTSASIAQIGVEADNTGAENVDLVTSGPRMSVRADVATTLRVRTETTDSSWRTGKAAARAWLEQGSWGQGTTVSAPFLFLGSDGPVFAPVQATVGEYFEQKAEYTYTPVLDDQGRDYFAPRAGSQVVADIWDFGDGVRVDLSFDEITGLPIVHVYGTPKNNDVAQKIVFSRIDLESGAESAPFEILIPVQAAAAAGTGMTPAAPELAATGVDTAPLGLGALALLAGFGLMMARRIRIRRS